MSKMSGVFLIGLWGVLLFWGCSNTPNDPAVTDPEVAVEDLAADEENDYLYDLGLDDQVEENMYVGYSSYSSDPQIPAITVDSTIRFGRKINRRAVRRVVVERLAPDTLLVRTRRDLAGFFFVFHQTDSATWRGFRKPMHHIAERSAIYVNTGSRDTDNRRNWQLQAVSLGSGRSATDASIRIHSVTVLYNNGADTLGFRNPAETYISRGNVPTFRSGEEVVVRVRLANNTANPVDPDGSGATEQLLLHYGAHRGDKARTQFRYVGNDPATGLQIYEGRWRVHESRGNLHQAIIDGIDNGTIYERDATVYPYNSSHWSIPYRVVD